MRTLCSLVLIAGLTGLQAAVPDFIKPCYRSEPNFNACALERAKDGIYVIGKGNRKLGIPNLAPLKIPELKMSEGPFQLTLLDLQIYGLDKSIPQNFNYDFDNRVFSMEFMVPEFRITSKYIINGRILLLPITGKGDFNCTMVNGKLTTTHELEMKKIKGKDHQKILDFKAKFTPERVYMSFTNLFNGDPLLGREMNVFLNENWKQIYEELGPRVDATFATIFESVLTKVNDAVPFDELFPVKQ